MLSLGAGYFQICIGTFLISRTSWRGKVVPLWDLSFLSSINDQTKINFNNILFPTLKYFIYYICSKSLEIWFLTTLQLLSPFCCNVFVFIFKTCSNLFFFLISGKSNGEFKCSFRKSVGNYCGKSFFWIKSLQFGMLREFRTFNTKESQ